MKWLRNFDVTQTVLTVERYIIVPLMHLLMAWVFDVKEMIGVLYFIINIHVGS